MDKNEGSGELAVLWLLRTGLRELASFFTTTLSCQSLPTSCAEVGMLAWESPAPL